MLTSAARAEPPQGAPLNESDHCGDPPLVLAAGNGHLACVRLLLSEGADIEQAGAMKDSALIRAAHNGHLHTVMFLVEAGADVNRLDLGDNSALHWAAMRGARTPAPLRAVPPGPRLRSGEPPPRPDASVPLRT